MFNITDDMIRKHCSPQVFFQGEEYYRAKKIKYLKYVQDKRLFRADVLGTEIYDVELQFDMMGNLDRVECDCAASMSHDGICNHAAAVLMLIREKDAGGFFNKLNRRDATFDIFRFFENRGSAVKAPVHLEVEYEFARHQEPGMGGMSSISLKIGQERMYVLRNLRDFFDKWEQNQEISFGKGFIFDPAIHDFQEQDKQLMAFLRELYEVERLMEGMSYYSTRTSLFKDKVISLTDTGVDRFFSIMEDKPFTAVINGELYPDMRVRKEDFPLQFHISRDADSLILEMEYPKPLIPLTADGRFFFAAGSIYRVSEKQHQHFKPFYMTLAYTRSSRLRFVENQMERFLSEIVPVAEKAGIVQVDEKVRELIQKNDLQAEMYMDREGHTITAQVKFIYGDRVINPFGPQEKAAPGDRIYLRDAEKEEIILDILGLSDFKVRNNHLYLEEDDSIFSFVHETVPKLQEYCSIFYSDHFNRMMVRESSFTGGIRLNAMRGALELDFMLEGMEPSELREFFYALRLKKKYFRLRDGTFIPLDTRSMQGIYQMADYLDLDVEKLKEGTLEIPKYRALYLDEKLREWELGGIERNKAFQDFVQNIREPAGADIQIPPALKGVLRDYQRFGFKWMKTLSQYGMGGILADDMGLGKTLQVIPLILSEQLEQGREPSLVVVPNSLLYNWLDEVQKFAPQLEVLLVVGTPEERLQLLKKVGEYDIVVTSYPLLRRDIELYSGLHFRYCILDEAQHIKNPGSQSARAVKLIQSSRRFALTGTPMENSLSELWSIFDFVMPGYLFSYHRFSEKYERPIIKEGDREAMAEISRQTRPFILRRLKTQVLKELPEKIEHKMTAELTEEQKKIYMAYLQEIRNEIENEITTKGFSRSHIMILAGLTRLRQICCHPSLFVEGYDGESGKMQLLEEIMDESLSGGHRILLFSQFTSMLGTIRQRMEEKGIDYMYLDGSTETEERIRMVKSFNNGKGSVFLISLKAGGTGLNLTGADTVIHYDPWWNPAVEDQATDRAYRMGQNKIVHVMKLITKGTIEEKIFHLQQRKKELIQSVIQPGETLLTKLTEDEIRELFL